MSSAPKLLCCLAIVSFLGCGSGTMSQAESDSRDALRELGAVVVNDPEGIHCGTLMFTSPEIGDVDQAISHVANLAYLTHLELTNLPITDEHMQTIKGLKRLNSLVLSGTNVGDEGLKRVSRLKLDTLYVDKSKLTSAAAEILAGMSKLKILDISGLDIAGNLAPLNGLPDLEWLIIEDVALDAGAIDEISQFPALGRFSITGTMVSEADLGRLKSSKPSLMIDGAIEEEPTEEQQTEQTGAQGG